MNKTLTKNNLTLGRRRLVELMQSTNYGKIKGLSVKAGQPVFDPPPRVVQRIKIAAANRSRTGSPSGDFTLKKEITEFFEHLDRLGTGLVKCIEVKDGLPFTLDFETKVRG